MVQDLIATYILEDLEDVNKNEIPKQSKIEDIDIKGTINVLNIKAIYFKVQYEGGKIKTFFFGNNMI